MAAEKKVNYTLVIAAIVVLVFVILQKKRAFDSMDLRPTFPRDFVFQAPTNISFILPFTAFNVSNGSLNLGSVDLRIFAEGQYIGRAYAMFPQTVFPMGQSVLNTRVIVSLIDIAAAVPGFLAGVQDQAVNWQMKGTINVEGFYLNIDIPLKFNLPKLR
jgi:hypothetical protein